MEHAPNTAPDGTPTLALVRDLLFSSKITAAAKAAGMPVKIIRDGSRLADQAGGRLLVDLNADGHLAAALEWKSRTAGEVIGFVAHVAGDAIAEARRLGVDRVMSNGGFSAQVEAILASPIRAARPGEA